MHSILLSGPFRPIPKNISVNWGRGALYCFCLRAPITLATPLQPPPLSKKVQSKINEGKRSPYSITERRVPELIPVLGSQPAGDVSHKPCDRLPLLSPKPAVSLATLKRAATSFAAW